MTYTTLDPINNNFICNQPLHRDDFNYIIKGINDLIGKTNTIGTYILNNEDRWSSEGLSEGGDTLEFPLSAINGLQTSSTNKILYYNNDGNWEYKDYKELKFPLNELYDLTSNNLDLDGTKWVLVYDLETLNDRGWKFLPYNTGTGSGLILGKVAYDLNTVNNPNTNVKQILVWDNDGNGTWKWLIENYTSTSPTTGLTWTDLTNPGNEKIHSSHLPSSWWGRSISNNIVEGNLSGNIQYIKFDSGGHTVYLGLDSDGNLRVSKSENGNDGSSGANFYATGGVSALGNSSSSGGGGTPGETSLKSLLNNVNDLGTNYSSPSTGYTIVYNNGSWIDRKLDLSELDNISINDVSNNDVLTYNGTNWVNSPALSVVSSLELLSDVEDNVSNIKVLNVIEPSGSILSYSYPLTLLVGSTSDTSSNIYNSEVTWKLYVFLLETDSTAAHLIGGGSLTSNMGIVTRLNFGQAGSPMNNYRFPTYITGVRLQSSDMTRYHITGAKHIKGKTINNNSQTWNLDYDETFCSDKVYIINDELYSNANKVLTTNSTLSSSNLNNNSVKFNGASASLGSSGTITPELVIDGNTIKSKVGNQTSGGITVPFATNATYATQFAAERILWGNLDSGDNSIGTNDHLDSLSYVKLIIFGNSNFNTVGEGQIRYYVKKRDINDHSNTDYYAPNDNLISVEALNFDRSSTRNQFDIGWGLGTILNAKTVLYGREIEFVTKEITNSSSGSGNSSVNMILNGLGQLYILNSTNEYTSGLRIGNAVLYCDASGNLALKSATGAACNFYATGGVSALGMSPGTSSIDAMTFGNLTVNDELNVISTLLIGNASIAESGDDMMIDLEGNNLILSGSLYMSSYSISFGDYNTPDILQVRNHHLYFNDTQIA